MTEHVFAKELIFEKLLSVDYWPSESLQPMDELLSFSWSKTTQKLELVVPMLMIDQEIQVNTNLVYNLNIDFFKNITKTGLVDVLLKRMQIHLKSLIFAHDWTPKIQNFVHGILLVSGQTDSLFENEGMIFQQLLTVVRTGEEFWNLWLSPDNNGLLVVSIFVVLIHHRLVVIIIILVLRTSEVCEFTKSFLKSSGFKAISRNDDEVNFISLEDLLECLLVSFMILLLFNIILVVEGSVVSHSFSWRTRFSGW